MRPTSLAFITPVWERFSMTEICLRQRRHVCDYLQEHYGLDATCIVIGSDENLDVARDMGFIAVHHENRAQSWAYNNGEPYVALGMKFNAGYVEAHKQGIDLVFPIGSDSWIDPIYFSELPERGELLLSRAYNIITPNAQRRGALWIGWEGGVQWISWTEDWAHRDYKPVSEELSKGCDTSTWVHMKPELRVGEHHHHQLEYVAFQSSSTNQITDYAAIMARYGAGEVQGARVFGDLAEHYQAADILAMQVHYNTECTKLAAEEIELMRNELAQAEQGLQTLLDEGQALHMGA